MKGRHWVTDVDGRVARSRIYCLVDVHRLTRAAVALTLESGWEVVENTDWVIDRYRAATMALGYYGDSVLNSTGDILACASGFALAARLPARVTVVLVVLLEVGLALWIRDSLLLQMVMLLWPTPAIKTWQLGTAGAAP